MKRYFLVLYITINSFCAYYATAQTKKLPADARERIRAKTAWIREVSEVAKKSGVPEAIALMKWAEKNAVAASPDAAVEGGFRVVVLEKPAELPGLVFLPLTSKDYETMPGLEKVLRTSEVAHYDHTIRGIVMRGQDMYTPQEVALVTIHEIKHAHRWLVDQPRFWNYCYEEVLAHEVENKVASAIGGAPYREALQAEMNRMIQYAQNNSIMIGESLIPSTTSVTGYDNRFDGIFGTVKSERDINIRDVITWIHANLAIVEKYFPNNALEKKIQVMCAIQESSRNKK